MIFVEPPPTPRPAPFPLDLGQAQHFSNSSQICQNVSLKEGNMENILYVNIVKLKPLEFGLFYLEGCYILISQIKFKLLRTLTAQKTFLI